MTSCISASNLPISLKIYFIRNWKHIFPPHLVYCCLQEEAIVGRVLLVSFGLAGMRKDTDDNLNVIMVR